MLKSPRQRDKKYMGVIAQLPSILSGRRPVHVCHVRYGDLPNGKRHTGMAEKPDDRWTLPLTAEEHLDGADAQHKGNERDWWRRRGIDPVAVCLELQAAYEASTSEIEALQRMEAIILRARMFRTPQKN